MTKPKVPSYRKQKKPGGDIAFVLLDGERTYLGRYGTPESRQRYQQVISEWLASNRQAPSDPELIRVVELIAKYVAFAEDYYRKPDGATTSESGNIKYAVKPLKELYGQEWAGDFGPLALKAVRQRMIEAGWCRQTINRSVSRICRMFRWATENELISPTVYHGLEAVAGLRIGRSTAPEPERIKPVADEVVDMTVARLTPTLAAMVQIQRLTGMRPSEICIIRGGDLDMSGPIWIYRPRRHKTQHHGKTREIPLGPRAQEVLRPFLRGDLQAPVFSPVQSEQERREARHAARKTPASCGNKPSSNRKRHPERTPDEVYSTLSYGKAIAQACNATWPLPADLERIAGENRPQWKERLGHRWLEVLAWRRANRWSPNQLRHSFASAVRKQFGLDATQVMLGHSKADVTQIYAEVDTAKALLVAAKIG